jgi:hypothetical protein
LNWALVVSIIVAKFIVDQCSFLLEALTWANNNTFLFQKHLKVACNLLPPLTHMCFPPFEQFIEQQMVQLQDSILECLHHHTVSNMLSDMIFKTHCAQILSCSSPKASVWFKVQPVFPTFRLFSPSFSTVFQMRLGSPRPSIINIYYCICTHPIDVISVHLFVTPMAMNA